jgi:hypothetical protein
LPNITESWDSSVAIVTRLQAADPGIVVPFPKEQESLLFSKTPKLALELTKNSIQYVMMFLSSGFKSAGMRCPPFISTYCRSEECVELGIHSPIRLSCVRRDRRRNIKGD